MRLLLVINIEAQAVGTLARLFTLGAPRDWQVRIVSCRDMIHNPTRFAAAVAESDLVHWTNHKIFSSAERYTRTGRHVVSLHHLEGDEEDLTFLLRAQGFVVHARKYLAEVTRRLPRLHEHVACIPYPVDDSFFELGARRVAGHGSAARRHPGPLRVGFFSAASYENARKGIDLLPAVWRELAALGIDATLVVTGLGWQRVLTGPDFRAVRAVYRMAPSYFDMPQLYGALDAYLCLSRIEGGPMTVFEAIACGVPVVSTEVGRIPDCLAPDTTYWRVPQDNAAAAAQALAAIHGEPERANIMSCRALEAIRTPLSVQRYQETFAAFYAEVAGLAAAPLAPADLARDRRQRRRWRAWDRTYWAKESWVAGRRGEALRHMAEAFLLDPACEGIWRVPLRLLGGGRDEV